MNAKGVWSEIPSSDVQQWNTRLQETTASLYQYPYWNAPYRQFHFDPMYLEYSVDGHPGYFLAVLTMRALGIRIGLIRYGPVALCDLDIDPKSMWSELVGWSKRNRFIFLRVTHGSEKELEAAGSIPGAKRLDAFPLFPEEKEELVVPLRADEDAMFSGLSHEVRRQIRRGKESGYEIECSDDPEILVSVWNLFAGMAERKNINTRPLPYWYDLMKGACGTGACRLYIAKHSGNPVQAIIVIRAGKTAQLVAGALDSKNLPTSHSPSYLLHWHAMKDFAAGGVDQYHIGNRAGPVYRFKKRFEPIETIPPTPVTIVVNELLFGLWTLSVLQLGQSLLPAIRHVVQSKKR
jgi:hypothetical protein